LGTIRQALLHTGTRELIYAALKDNVWGIGKTKRATEIMLLDDMRYGWGNNVLRVVLMQIRDKFVGNIKKAVKARTPTS
jgi:predicted NAD-dependent protein-ADP-ribosyltransferase YbiA (DUF1768 family)